MCVINKLSGGRFRIFIQDEAKGYFAAVKIKNMLFDFLKGYYFKR